MAKKIANFDYEAINQKGEKVKETLANVLGELLLLSCQKQDLKGIGEFKQQSIYSKALQRAMQTGYIELEDSDYDTLVSRIKYNIPAYWGINANVAEVIEKFLKE